MENASKSLLFAASVLIVILLIAFGITIFNSSRNSAEESQTVGESLSSATSSAKIKTILSMIDYKDETIFKNFIEENFGNGKALTPNDVIELYEIITTRTEMLYGKKYENTAIHPTSNPVRCTIYYDTSTQRMNYNNLENRNYYLRIVANPAPSGPAAIVRTTKPT